MKRAIIFIIYFWFVVLSAMWIGVNLVEATDKKPEIILEWRCFSGQGWGCLDREVDENKELYMIELTWDAENKKWGEGKVSTFEDRIKKLEEKIKELEEGARDKNCCWEYKINITRKNGWWEYKIGVTSNKAEKECGNWEPIDTFPIKGRDVILILFKRQVCE